MSMVPVTTSSRVTPPPGQNRYTASPRARAPSTATPASKSGRFDRRFGGGAGRGGAGGGSGSVSSSESGSVTRAGEGSRGGAGRDTDFVGADDSGPVAAEPGTGGIRRFPSVA